MTSLSTLTNDLGILIPGPVLTPDDPGYAEETATFNPAVTHRPALVVCATSVSDVQVAVRHAAEANVPIALSNAGHSQPVPMTGAMLINLRRMDDVRIDTGAGTAQVGPGARWGQVIELAAEAGLAPLAGSSPNVGVIGYTLGGGNSPFLGRRYGWAADHVRSLQVVIADGSVREVTAATDPELFWALLGGKGNFGVVVSLTFNLFPVASLYGGGLFFDGGQAAAVLPVWRELTESAPWI